MNIYKIVLFLLTVTLMAPLTVFTHCDSMDGPVIKSAQKALEIENVNLVLIWVKLDDEVIIRKAFDKTLKIRKLNKEARELADMYFFETLVRIHRAGEGAPFTGIKPVGTEIDPGIKIAEEAIEKNSPEEIFKHLEKLMQGSLHNLFMEVKEKKNFNPNNVKAGREYVKAYVEFIHFVENLFEASKISEKEHEHHEHEMGKLIH